jgi:hypothetical protein
MTTFGSKMQTNRFGVFRLRACRQLIENNFHDSVNVQAGQISLCQARGGAGEWDDVMRCGTTNGM